MWIGLIRKKSQNTINNEEINLKKSLYDGIYEFYVYMVCMLILVFLRANMAQRLETRECIIIAIVEC